MLTAEAGKQVYGQQNGQQEKALAEPADDLVGFLYGAPRFLLGLRQADVPYQIMGTGLCFYCFLYRSFPWTSSVGSAAALTFRTGIPLRVE